LFITFEGIEGCGKSSQARRLADRLKQLGIPLLLTLEPGGTSIGTEIRRVLLDSRNHELSPLAELLLYEADRAQHVSEVIAPALEKGKWVLCDRFFDATTVYQGCGRGLDLRFVQELNGRASFGIRPDITFLIDCPVHVGIKRALERNESLLEDGQDRFERERFVFHEAVRRGYLALAIEESRRFVITDGTLTEKDVEEQIFKHIAPYLPVMAQ